MDALLPVIVFLVAAVVIVGTPLLWSRWRMNREIARLQGLGKEGANSIERLLENPDRGVIEFTDTGLMIRIRNEEPRIVLWESVKEIGAFKRDLIITDLICFEFSYEENAEDKFIGVDEEMMGFEALVGVLPQQFAGFDTDWWAKVAHPAFASNHTILWRRDRAASELES